jgi:hypothetical protein
MFIGWSSTRFVFFGVDRKFNMAARANNVFWLAEILRIFFSETARWAKKGDKFDPGNNRGISIRSNLGKRFNRVIYKRLLTFMNNKNLISKNQGLEHPPVLLLVQMKKGH